MTNNLLLYLWAWMEEKMSGKWKEKKKQNTYEKQNEKKKTKNGWRAFFSLREWEPFITRGLLTACEHHCSIYLPIFLSFFFLLLVYRYIFLFAYI